MAAAMPARAKVYDSEAESRDLGFGAVLSSQRRLRLLNRDGSFNVDEYGRSPWARLGGYHALLNLSWPKFFLLVAVAYLVVNGFFAGLFLLCGPGALVGTSGTDRPLEAFFFSVHTLATIGYGNVVPHGLAANLVVTGESLVGLLGFAFAAGLVFARFSRPRADILYSHRAVVAPYRGITAFEFRIVNRRENQLIELGAKVMLSRFEEGADGSRLRRYHTLALERDAVSFFPLNWTVVHPIDESSPLFGWTDEQLRAAEGEFLVLLTAIDETFSQTVHSRSSYTAEEVVWGARFAPLLSSSGGGLDVDWSRFHRVEPTPAAAAAPAAASEATAAPQP